MQHAYSMCCIITGLYNVEGYVEGLPEKGAEVAHLRLSDKLASVIVTPSVAPSRSFNDLHDLDKKFI